MPSFEHSVDRVLNGSLALGIKCRCLRNIYAKKKERAIELSKENLDTILIIMRYKSASCSKCYTYRLIEQKNARAPHRLRQTSKYATDGIERVTQRRQIQEESHELTASTSGRKGMSN